MKKGGREERGREGWRRKDGGGREERGRDGGGRERRREGGEEGREGGRRGESELRGKRGREEREAMKKDVSNLHKHIIPTLFLRTPAGPMTFSKMCFPT